VIVGSIVYALLGYVIERHNNRQSRPVEKKIKTIKTEKNQEKTKKNGQTKAFFQSFFADETAKPAEPTVTIPEYRGEKKKNPDTVVVGDGINNDMTERVKENKQ